MIEYPRVEDSSDEIDFDVVDVEILLDDLILDARDARAMIAERDAEIAELRAVIAAVNKLTRIKVRRTKIGWITTANGPLIAALGKYADEVAE